MRIDHPITGMLKMVCLASHFISHGRWERRKMSAYDSWLLTATYGRRGSRTELALGAEVPPRVEPAPSAPIQRKVRPAA
jgi:hypothetical protein